MTADRSNKAAKRHSAALTAVKPGLITTKREKTLRMRYRAFNPIVRKAILPDQKNHPG